jgi:hypothetical protein
MMADVRKVADKSRLWPVRARAHRRGGFGERFAVVTSTCSLAGNALAVRCGTFAIQYLGVDLETGKAIHGGHRHHIRASIPSAGLVAWQAVGRAC